MALFWHVTKKSLYTIMTLGILVSIIVSFDTAKKTQIVFATKKRKKSTQQTVLIFGSITFFILVAFTGEESQMNPQ